MDKKYMWDLDSILGSQSLEQLFEQHEQLKQKTIESYKTFLDSKENFINWIKLEEELEVVSNRLYNYISNNLNTNVVDQTWNGWMQKFTASYYELSSALSGYNTTIINNESKVRSYLEDSSISAYTKKFEAILRYKPYTLNERESQLYTLLTRQNGGFHDVYSTFTNNDMEFAPALDSKNKKHIINNEADAFMLLKNKDRTLRKNAYISMYNAYFKNKETLTQLLYNNYLYLNQQAKAKNFEDYIAQTAFDDEVEKSLIPHIYEQVKKYKPVYEKFNKLRTTYLKHLLKVNKVEAWDRSVPLTSKNVNVEIEEAKQLALESLAILGDEYKSHIQRAFDENWVDFLPKKGKRGGAYSIGGTKGMDKYFILMNYDNSIRAVQTLVHELGHSMHSLYSNKHQPIYNSYKIFYAEIASVIHEAYLNGYLLKKYENDLETKLMILDEMISGFFATTTRQVIFSEFEWKANEWVNNGESFTSDKVMQAYDLIQQEYTGLKPLAKFHPINSLQSITPLRIPHFYAGNFYVYKYSIGQVAALIAGQRVLDDAPNAKTNVFNFLSSGGSKTPLDTIKLLGVDLTQSEPWQEALSICATWLEEYESVIKKITTKKARKI